MPQGEAAAAENGRSSSVIWEFWSLLVAAESSRGGSHLTQLLPSTQLGALSILAVRRTSSPGEGVAKSLTDVSLWNIYFSYVIKVCSIEGLQRQEVYLFLNVHSNSRAAWGPEEYALKNANNLVCLKMTPQRAGKNTVCQHNVWRNKIPICIKLWRDQLLSIKSIW